jgi:hypothetical protein
VDETFITEDFENDPVSPRTLVMPYLTGNHFSLRGGKQSYPEIVDAPQLLRTGNLLHFRSWWQGVTITFPASTPATAFGFDYTSPEVWVLSFNNVSVELPPANGGFIGIVVHQEIPREFTLSSSADLQGGLSMDNLSYVAWRP